MSLEVVTDARLMTAADEAHRRLRDAVEQLENDQWALADAIWDAYERQAWEHDDGADRDRYEVVMIREQFSSIFPAYCSVEFGMRASWSQRMKRAGRLRSTCPIGHVDWTRFSRDAIRPIGAGVLNQFEGDDIAQALVDAQRSASASVVQRPDETPIAFEARRSAAPVTGKYVTAALRERGLVVKRPADVVEREAKERRAAKLERAERLMYQSVGELLKARRRKAVVEMITAFIGRLVDQPAALAQIRQALDEAASS